MKSTKPFEITGTRGAYSIDSFATAHEISRAQTYIDGPSRRVTVRSLIKRRQRFEKGRNPPLSPKAKKLAAVAIQPAE